MIYEAEEYESKQEILHERLEPEGVARAYRKINRFRIRNKLKTLEIVIPEAKKIKEEVGVHGGDCCVECGSTKLIKTGSCACCECCGTSQGCS